MIERRAQAAMVVVLNGHEAEWLQHAFGCLPHRIEDFGHSVHRARLRLKRNLDEVAIGQRVSQVEQSACRGDGLEFSFGAPAVF